MQTDPLIFDALILAGGRSSRLGGVPKQSLVLRGRTLLAWTLDAAAGARRTVVVGDVSAGGPPSRGAADEAGPAQALPPGVLSCREEPKFAGPAAGISAGLDALATSGGGAPFTLVLACDMPLAARAVAMLRDAVAAAGDGRGAVARSADGREQPLAAIYNTDELKRSCGELSRRDALVNGSVRSLLANLDVQLVTVPAGSTADVDTWGDAATLGIAAGSQREDFDQNVRSQRGRQVVKSQDETLEEWCRALLQAYKLEDVQVDVNAVLSLAGVAAHAVIRPAAPLTTFIAGFAAGLAAAPGREMDTASMEAAMAVARSLAADYENEAAAGTPGE
ncbi:NTP transferase domain-containing protein [Arthrobacter sp. 135MFCol5.1]|uniref:NTP transferase domain-containing protein n=1 Tax=Arthrobacter sp. 135MFCol5.1 TaxID=1158050 RepID=UPI0003A7094A|nr:NTP transferase domain-containing protein [Arthrobacter sp. 135MFCol5.1]